MSYRGTSKLGAELFGDGQFEGSPAEMPLSLTRHLVHMPRGVGI